MKGYIESLKSLPHQQLVLMLARQKTMSEASIAITGMAFRFPGNVNTEQELWRSICDKTICTSSLLDKRWNTNAIHLNQSKHILNFSGLLKKTFHFDANFFGIAESDVAYMEPQQRVLLELSYQALTHANIVKAKLEQKRVGIFNALSLSEYSAFQSSRKTKNDATNISSGITLSASAGRMAFHLGLNGPAITVDTACSSSLVAIYQAMQSLRNNECDIAIVGSAHFILSPFTTTALDKACMLSTSGSSRPFDKLADGYVRSEGAAVIVLKREQDANDDCDEIHGLIRGGAVHQQGIRTGVHSPSDEGQVTAIRNALKSANVEPHEVCYVEASGAGNRLNDVIEIESLMSGYQRHNRKQPTLFVGSAKANFGHMETTSGMLSLIKALLVVKNSQVPPQANFDNPEPRVEWEKNSIVVASKMTSLPQNSNCLAGVSSLGYTGTDAHLIIQAAKKRDSHFKFNVQSEVSPVYFPILLSAHSKKLLLKQARDLLDYLQSGTPHDLRSISYTLAVGRDVFDYRYAVCVKTVEELISSLSAFEQQGYSNSNMMGDATKISDSTYKPLISFSLASNKSLVKKYLMNPEKSSLVKLMIKLAVSENLLSSQSVSVATEQQVEMLYEQSMSFLALFTLARLKQLYLSGIDIDGVNCSADSIHALKDCFAHLKSESVNTLLSIRKIYQSRNNLIDKYQSERYVNNDVESQTEKREFDFCCSSLDSIMIPEFIVKLFLSGKQYDYAVWFDQNIKKLSLPVYPLDSKYYPLPDNLFI